MEIKGFMVIALIAYIFDIISSKCLKTFNPIMQLLLFMHHLLTIVIYYGWLSNNKTFLWIYLFIPTLFLLYWKLNKGRCSVTVKFNEYCGIDKNESFHDFLYMLNLQTYKRSKIVICIYAIICAIITIYKLSRHT